MVEQFHIARLTHNTIDGHDFTENNTANGLQFAVSYEVSRASHLIKFLVAILGALTPPPIIEAPVMKIPLRRVCATSALETRK